MRFIIVDNNEKTQKEVRNLVLKETFEKSDTIIDQFTSFNKKLEEIINDNSEPKVYILDIELEDNISGIEIAKMIREDDWQSHIIFITNHDKMFEQTFREVSEVFDFIEKFHNMEQRLSKDIKKIINKEFDNSVFVYSNRNIDLNLYLKDMLYIERDTNDRKLIIHTTNNEFAINMSLNEIITKLDRRFRRTHKSCIVNKTKVTKFDWANKFFILINKEKINLLSRNYKKEVLAEDEH